MVTREQLLAEVDDLLRTIPNVGASALTPGAALMVSAYILEWSGRACAVIERWDHVKSLQATAAANNIRLTMVPASQFGLQAMTTLLFQARADLRMELGAGSVIAQTGEVFRYFDELRKIIELAASEVLFVDPYLDAEFVSR